MPCFSIPFAPQTIPTVSTDNAGARETTVHGKVPRGSAGMAESSTHEEEAEDPRSSVLVNLDSFGSLPVDLPTRFSLAVEKTARDEPEVLSFKGGLRHTGDRHRHLQVRQLIHLRFP